MAKAAHLTSVHSAGDIRIFYKEARTLARNGWDVTVIGNYPADSVIDQVRIKAIQSEENRIARMTRTVWKVYREAQQVDADIYHFHDPELIPVGLLLRTARKKVIYDVHEDVPKDILSKFYLPLWSRKLLSWFAGEVQALSSRHFSAVVAVTPSIAERFRATNCHTVVVRNFPYSDELSRTFESSPWESRPPVVAYIGTITAQRGIREMVHAMALLPDSLGAKLELAGNEIPEHCHPRELRAHPGWVRVEHRVILGRDGVAQLLSRSRVGLVLFHPKPNHWEAMPNKLFEYMSAGLPVIASDFPLWREMIAGSGCGMLVDPLDPSAIAKAIEYLLAHPNEAREMGRRGKEAVLRNYNWESQEPELLNLYSQLMAPASEPVRAGSRPDRVAAGPEANLPR